MGVLSCVVGLRFNLGILLEVTALPFTPVSVGSVPASAGADKENPCPREREVEAPFGNFNTQSVVQIHWTTMSVSGSEPGNHCSAIVRGPCWVSSSGFLGAEGAQLVCQRVPRYCEVKVAPTNTT